MTKTYTPLHNHTTHSKLDGASRISEFVSHAKSMGINSLGISDHGTLSGWLEFYKECHKQDVKPVLGIEAYFAPDRLAREKFVMESKNDEIDGSSKYYQHLSIIAKNQAGYHNTIKISSDAYINGMYSKPRTDFDFLSQHSDGLIILSGCLGGPILQHLLHGDYDGAKNSAATFQDIVGKENFFIEIMDHGLPEQNKTNPYLFKLAKELDAKTVFSLDSHYVHQNDCVTHDHLLCLSTGSTINTPNRFRFENNEFYLKSPNEVYHVMRDYPETIDNTLLIAEMCDVEIDFDTNHYPEFDFPKEYNSDTEFLRKLAFDGLNRVGKNHDNTYIDRVEYELSVIDTMGFSSYFLILWDLMEFMNSENIQRSPGRGSSSGSIICWLLNVTMLDPIEYDLPFERFLNPARVTAPDVDLDIPNRDRDRVIQYTKDKYGEDKVAGISTTDYMLARTAIRDAARILEKPYMLGDKLSKAIPESVAGVSVPLKACLEPDPRFESAYVEAAKFREIYSTDLDAREIVDAALNLEGLMRNKGQHAAGIIIADRPIVELAPLEKSKNGPAVTQWDKKGVESIGLLKMDFLGLINLDIVSDACRFAGISTDDIPFDDSKAFDLFRSGETVGVFQLGSKSMQDLLVRMQPTDIYDISAALALYRPGPIAMDWHTLYADRKNGRVHVDYFHPDAKDFLAETQGLMIYQESLMTAAQHFAGYSLADADILRRIIGRKEVSEMEAEKPKFIQGCINQGYDEDFAEELFHMLEGFALYGFSKLHSMAYSVMSIWTAYLKANYPKEYMAALCSAFSGNKERLTEYIYETRRMGLKVYPPHINKSSHLFTPEDDGIRIGLSAVDGLSVKAADKIIVERDKNGDYVSLHDFFIRTRVNSKVFTNFAKIGAFEGFGSRLGIASVADDIINFARKQIKKNDLDQLSLFGDDSNQDIDIPKFEYSDLEKLSVEKEICGSYLSGHPIDFYDDLATGHVVSDLFTASPNPKPYSILSYVSEVRPKTTRKGDAMAFVTIEDGSGEHEIIFFPRDWVKVRHSVVVGAIGVVDVKVSVNKQSGDINFVGSTFTLVPSRDTDYSASNEFSIYLPKYFVNTPQYMAKLKGLVLQYKGDYRLKLFVSRSSTVKMQQDYLVDNSVEFVNKVRELFVEFQEFRSNDSNGRG